MVFWLVVVLVAVTVFALSNTDTVTVRFWQWPLYTGPLALALIGSGVLGALAVFVASVARHARLGGQLRHLETRLRALEAGPSQGHAAPPPGSLLTRRTDPVEHEVEDTLPVHANVSLVYLKARRGRVPAVCEGAVSTRRKSSQDGGRARTRRP